jgi:hypothetical protein
MGSAHCGYAPNINVQICRYFSNKNSYFSVLIKSQPVQKSSPIQRITLPFGRVKPVISKDSNNLISQLKTFSCSKCEKVFISEQHLEVHLLIVHDEMGAYTKAESTVQVKTEKAIFSIVEVKQENMAETDVLSFKQEELFNDYNE